MIRNNILGLLKAYHSNDQHEQTMVHNTIDFITSNPECFERSLLQGHITGSAWILNNEKTHALLMHHAKLNQWLQPGGHCDGDPDVTAVAAKEAFEETGIDVKLVSPAVFDVDHHVIPERKGIPEHIHYDIRFLFEAEKTSDELPANPEAKSVRWIPLEVISDYNNSPSVMRMVEKCLS